MNYISKSGKNYVSYCSIFCTAFLKKEITFLTSIYFISLLFGAKSLYGILLIIWNLFYELRLLSANPGIFQLSLQSVVVAKQDLLYACIIATHYTALFIVFTWWTPAETCADALMDVVGSAARWIQSRPLWSSAYVRLVWACFASRFPNHEGYVPQWMP